MSESLRKRWSKSVHAPLIPLPPPPTWRDVSADLRIPYAMTDAVAHLAVHRALWPRIIAQGLRPIYEIDRGVLPFLIRNEQVGLACDADALRDLSRVFAASFAQCGAEIDRLAGFHVNPCSGDQVSDCLFEQLGVTPTRLTRGGKHYTTADKYLKARKSEHLIIPRILEARQLNKYMGTYVNKLPSMLRDGRYYPDWKYTRTATGRLAEEIILLIPKHDPLAAKEGRINRAKAIRNCFHATDGHTLVSVDLSQIELRVMAHVSKDRKLIAAYARGEDLHAGTAHDLLGAPRRKEDQDESAHRLPAKTVNFGIINGMTEFGMLDQLHEAGQLQWDIEQVKELLAAWFKNYKGVADFWETQKAHARGKGWVRDLFGRRRMISGIWSTDERIRRGAERECLFAIQASADAISKIWNKRIWTRCILPRHAEGKRYIEPWVRVHDDTTLEVDTRIARTVRQEMLRLVPDLLCIPTTAEGKLGTQWGDLH